jgi:hypothetical protein
MRNLMQKNKIRNGMWKPQKYIDILCLIQKNNTNTERVFFPRVEKNIEIDVQDVP